MSPALEQRLRALERQEATLRARVKSLDGAERNEAYRKIVLIEDEIARINTPNAV